MKLVSTYLYLIGGHITVITVKPTTKTINCNVKAYPPRKFQLSTLYRAKMLPV